MRTAGRGAVFALVVSLVGWMAVPTAASAATPTATIVGGGCAGKSATLTWTPPEDVTGLTGYVVERMYYSPGMVYGSQTWVGRQPTSLEITVGFGLNTFLIRPVTAAGMGDPFASTTTFGVGPPRAMTWRPYPPDPAEVGDGTATVYFGWAGPVTWSSTGGSGATIQVTASPGGATVTMPVPGTAHDGSAVPITFTGLTNGVAYTFTAVVSNGCGSGGPQSSAVYVPGVRPTWVEASPPLALKRNKSYSYQFTASGSPTPTYQLVDAPAWLTVASDGTVSGDPPTGTTSFSYSITADNGVGVRYPGRPEAEIAAGPFTVTVGKNKDFLRTNRPTP